MKTYWDLTEKDRAALTETDVERFVAAELMTKGVLRAGALELVPEPEMPAPDVELHTVGHHYGSYRLAFRTADEAARVAAAAVVVHNDYINGKSVEFLDATATEAVAVQSERAYSKGRLAECRAAIEKATAAKTENDRRRKKHDEASKKERETLKGLWEDWFACRDKAARLREVVGVFEEYTATAGGDRDVAARFLAKVCTPEDITDAREWLGAEIPVVEVSDERLAPSPVDAPAEAAF